MIWYDSGIGYALAKEFLKAGDNVLICSRSGVQKFLVFQYVSYMHFVYFVILFDNNIKELEFWRVYFPLLGSNIYNNFGYIR